MEYVAAFAKLGGWFAVYPLGVLTLAFIGNETRCLRRSVLITLCVGSAVATLLLIALALAGWFSPTAIGIAGWLLAAGWCWRSRPWMTVARGLRERPLARAQRPALLAVLAVVALAAVLYGFFPKESLLGERDEAIYAQHALHLMRSGGSAIDLVALGIAQDPAILAIEQGRAAELPGIYPTGDRWTFQFSAATPVWMAMLGSVLGPQGIFRFNALVGVLNCLAFFVLARRMLKPAQRMWAVAALVVFALQPAQVWISRNSLSEPFCSWFVLNGLVVAMVALSRRSRRLGWLAGGLIGMATVVRIDAIVFPLAIVLAWLVVALTARARGDVSLSRTSFGQASLRQASFRRASFRRSSFNPAAQEIAFGCAVVVALALAYFLGFVQPYLLGLADRVLGATIAAALCAGLARALQNSNARIPASFAERGDWVLALAALLLFAYALWIRPHMQPYALIESKLVPHLNGQRDYREASLLNVSAYLSLPVILAAGVGVALGLASAWRGRDGAARTWAFVFLLVPTLVYLWQPMVSPDHIWAARRWSPAVFPACIVFATIACATLSRHWRAGYAWAAVAVIGVGLGANLLWSQRDTLRLREDAGMVAQVAAIAAQLPPERISHVVAAGPLASALLTGFAAKAVPVAAASGAQWDAICGGESSGDVRDGCVLVHPAGLDIGRADAVVLARLQIRRLRRNTGNVPLVHGTHEEVSDWNITAIGR